MPVRSLLTFVQPSDIEKDPDALSLALGWAGALGARVVVLTFPVDVLGEGGPSSADEAQDQARARSVISALEDKTGVSCTVVDRSSFAYGIGEIFADHLKVADLGILHGRRGPLVGERLLAHTALFASGRPLVLAPRQTSGALPRRALIAWDGTHAAARALHDALGILTPGSEAIVARVTDDKAMRMDQSGIEAANHLARHGLKASFQEVPRGGRDVFDAILATAHQSGCDLIVAGAVRHSAAHDLIFGSVTQRVLDGDCDLPVLLSA
jgi:nucleotide-binding universal stress UspA family protein